MAPPAKGAAGGGAHDRPHLARVFIVMTVAAISSSLLFNLTTNGNGQLLRERFAAITADPALLGMLLAVVYVIASLAQVAVGLMIDRYPLKRLYIAFGFLQAPFFAAAAIAEGWALFALQIAFMIAVFGAIPFTDAMIVRYVDDRMRSRVSGMRLAVAFGFSSLAVYLLGPVVKAAGFATLLLAMACIALVTLAAITLLPSAARRPAIVTVSETPPPQSPRAAG
jgi:MFS family permease